MKKLALDVGDKWVGSAIADALGITCKPYKTVEFDNLFSFIKTVIEEEYIDTIVVGYPKTNKGTESEQTKKTVRVKEELEKEFSQIKWILWDERLSSRRAAQLRVGTFKTKEDKIKSHSIAAAFILQSFLDNLAFQKL